MEIALVNFFDANYDEVGAISVPNKRAYCAQHGYDYILEHEALDPTRPASWNKLKLMQQYIGQYQALFWNDTDTLIMNPAITLESLLLPQKPIIVGSDNWGINCGNFIIQNEPGIDAVLQEWWDKDDDVFHPWWEQKALMNLIATKSEWRDRIGIQPERKMNSHLIHYEDGDFLIHFAGFGRNKQNLIDIMKAWV